MTFEDFARQHGVIIDRLVSHKWVSTPTEDKPRSRNGRYKFMGNVGWVQNWATMNMPVMWRGQRMKPSEYFQMVKDIKKDEKERKKMSYKAAQKAAWILHQCKPMRHPYLEAKGFKDEIGNVWETDDHEQLLVIPMRISGNLVGIQLINHKGEKKFLNGQITKGATFTMDAKGIPIFVEGYATGLSVRSAMKAVGIRYTIHVCFSAGNLELVAGQVPGGFIVADNDRSGVGERVADKVGKPYWLSPTVGEDFNDYHKSAGLFQAAQSIKRLILDYRLQPAA